MKFRIGAIIVGASLGCHHPHPRVPVQPEPPPPTGITVQPPNVQPPVVAPAPVPATTYRLLVAAPQDNRVLLVAFKPCQPEEAPPACGATVERQYDVTAPRGVAMVEGGTSFLVLTQGATLERYDVASGARLGSVGRPGAPDSLTAAAGGVVMSRDGRYAFVTPGGGGPGTMSIVDLKAQQRVGTVAVGKMAGAIALMSP